MSRVSAMDGIRASAQQRPRLRRTILVLSTSNQHGERPTRIPSSAEGQDRAPLAPWRHPRLHTKRGLYTRRIPGRGAYITFILK
jgi:hypothetical protein